MLQIIQNDVQTVRTIKRILIDETSVCLREERFFFSEKLVVKSFGEAVTSGSDFVAEWYNRNTTLVRTCEQEKNYDEMIEQAAIGILFEGKKGEAEFAAEAIADQLRSIKNKCLEHEASQLCVKIYTAETFLYHLVNKVLREDDKTKVQSLGPYCYLLSRHVFSRNDKTKGFVYRGASLDQQMINDYRDSVGKTGKWLSYSSTSKNRLAAEMFAGNALFVINLDKDPHGIYHKDLNLLSHYPDEEEVLLKAGTNFTIDKVEKDEKDDKYLIYLTITQEYGERRP
ncbi:unnamed protein product [Didymodactylos carnosus]|uniref:ADP ribosyltransferase domain-containing protein n=1 Tax=Didymodactylos carnosus TaxID=1234261 RepID=A0A815HG00_9BILA|nr:unnamed protein product [Didymodactylos carnosus]CAF1353612.1 unnamed protein product [Didymodactylos carnosus]CAF4017841.1 unnamed protein product [Didymodactylos carnosus]CAF4225921.1 unnamed protein product [Didymodactylos carnosus]